MGLTSLVLVVLSSGSLLQAAVDQHRAPRVFGLWTSNWRLWTPVDGLSLAQREAMEEGDGDRRDEQRREDWAAWRTMQGRGFLHEGIDGLFASPRVAVEGAIDLARSWFPQEGRYSLEEERDASMVSRVLQVRVPEHGYSPFREFVETWMDRQNKIFGEAGEAYLLGSAVERGEEDIDYGDLRYEERKVFLDVFRKVYLSRYFVGEKHLRGDAWRIREWKTIDFIAGPPILAAYTYLRGWERKIRFVGTNVHVKIEPPIRILAEQGDSEGSLIAAAGLEWEIPGIPLRLIASVGIDEGDATLDFIGIGTNLGIAKKAVFERRER